jgi:hypothetical protein
MAGQSGRLELLTLRPILFVAPGSSWFAIRFAAVMGAPTMAAPPRQRRHGSGGNTCATPAWRSQTPAFERQSCQFLDISQQVAAMPTQRALLAR